MADDSIDLTPGSAPEASTHLDSVGPGDPGQAQHRDSGAEDKPEPAKPEAPKKESRLDAIKRAEADVEKAQGEPKPAAKPEVKAEPEGKTDEGAQQQSDKPQAASEGEPEGNPEGRPEPRQRNGERLEAPREFLPRAKEAWRNTPHEVRSEIYRQTQEHEAALAQHSEAAKRYADLKPFDELARTNGRDLRDSLVRVNNLENLMQRSPLAGLNAVLQEIGPKRADGQALSLWDVVQHVAQMGPEGYNTAMQAAHSQAQGHAGQQGQQRSEDPRIATLEQQINDMRVQQLSATIIDPFKSGHSRFDELQDDIAFFLESGKIPQSMSPHERLAAAYDMAERINPPSRGQPAASPAAQMPDSRADDDFGGSKSVRGAPANGLDISTRRKGKSSRSDALDRAFADHGF